MTSRYFSRLEQAVSGFEEALNTTRLSSDLTVLGRSAREAAAGLSTLVTINPTVSDIPSPEVPQIAPVDVRVDTSQVRAGTSDFEKFAGSIRESDFTARGLIGRLGQITRGLGPLGLGLGAVATAGVGLVTALRSIGREQEQLLDLERRLGVSRGEFQQQAAGLVGVTGSFDEGRRLSVALAERQRQIQLSLAAPELDTSAFDRGLQIATSGLGLTVEEFANLEGGLIGLVSRLRESEIAVEGNRLQAYLGELLQSPQLVEEALQLLQATDSEFRAYVARQNAQAVISEEAAQGLEDFNAAAEELAVGIRALTIPAITALGESLARILNIGSQADETDTRSPAARAASEAEGFFASLSRNIPRLPGVPLTEAVQGVSTAFGLIARSGTEDDPIRGLSPFTRAERRRRDLEEDYSQFGRFYDTSGARDQGFNIRVENRFLVDSREIATQLEDKLITQESW